jgi:hypothetical protein
MKTSIFLPPFLMLIVIVAVGCVRQENQPGKPTEAPVTSSSVQIAVTPENLQFLDFNFTSIDPTDPRLIKAITQDQAVKSALKFEPLGKNATSISTQVGYFDKVSGNDLQINGLVWLVTYYGVDTVSSGPPGSDIGVSHTLTVAVDAYQGVGIVSMNLAIVTPGPDLTFTPTPLSK